MGRVDWIFAGRGSTPRRIAKLSAVGVYDFFRSCGSDMAPLELLDGYFRRVECIYLDVGRRV